MSICAFRVSGHDQPYPVRLNHGEYMPKGDGTRNRRGSSPNVSLHFSIPKFGRADISETFMIGIEPSDFADLARQMMKADPQEKLSARLCRMSKFQLREGNGKRVTTRATLTVWRGLIEC